MARAEIPRLAEYVYLAPTLGSRAAGSPPRITDLFTTAIRPVDAATLFNNAPTIWGPPIPSRRTNVRFTDYVETVAASASALGAYVVRRSQYPSPDDLIFERTLLIIPPIPPIEKFYEPSIKSIRGVLANGQAGTITRTGTSPSIVRPTVYHEIVATERGAYDIDLLVLITERKTVNISPIR